MRDNELENPVYPIRVDGRGAITCLIDKTRGHRQFPRTVNGRAINDLGAGAQTSGFHYLRSAVASASSEIDSRTAFVWSTVGHISRPRNPVKPLAAIARKTFR